MLQDEVLIQAISYISSLHDKLVARVRTHGERYLQCKQLNARNGIVGESSSKEEIILYLHELIANKMFSNEV